MPEEEEAILGRPEDSRAEEVVDHSLRRAAAAAATRPVGPRLEAVATTIAARGKQEGETATTTPLPKRMTESMSPPTSTGGRPLSGLLKTRYA